MYPDRLNILIIAIIILVVVIGATGFSNSQVKRDLENLANLPQEFTEAYEKIKIFEAWNLFDALRPDLRLVNIGVIDTGVDATHQEFNNLA